MSSSAPASRRRWIRLRIPVGAMAAALGFYPWAVLPLAAQSPANQTQSTPAGWVFTPGIAVAESFDTNVLLATEGSETASDFLTAVSPRGALTFRGRRTTFQADYRGSYQLYQELSELNAFDQRANASFAYRLTPSHTVFVRNNLSKSPSTDEVDIPGVTFRRQGVLMDDLRAGVESRLGRRTSLNAAYTFQWIDFKESEALLAVDPLRRGGHGHGASAELDHVLTPRLTVGAEYEMRHGTVDEIRGFDVMNALGTVGWRLKERLELSAAAGLSSLVTSISDDLVASRSDERRSAPAFRVGLAGTGSRLGWNVNYRRSFMPSFGFGGTFDNEELQAGFISALTRRLDLTGTFSIRENDPLTSDDVVTEALGLRSIWARSSVSYLATRWMRIEGFYTAVFQDSRRPGGRVNRSRVGVQVVTFTRTRIR